MTNITEKQINVMLDLETAGTGPSSAIAAIGATTFYRDGTVPSPASHFYHAIDLESAVAAGGTIDASTFKWWMKQSAEARQCFEGTATIPEALVAFSAWFESLGEDPASIKIWACGPDFDITILGEAYKRCGMTAPWSFWNVRCFRTLKAEYPLVAFERTGTHHNALDDAISQAKHVMKIDIQVIGAAIQAKEARPLPSNWKNILEEFKDFSPSDKGMVHGGPYIHKQATIDALALFAKAQESLDLDAAARLRHVCDLVGLKDAVPADNVELWDCAFSVLGIIRRALEQRPANTTQALMEQPA